MASTFWNASSQMYDLDSSGARVVSYNKFRSSFCAAWLGAMIPIGVCFYAFTPEQQKKTKLFRLQLLCIFLAMVYNSSEVGKEVYEFKVIWYKADRELNYLFFVFWIDLGHLLDHIVPILADSALLFRLSSFFPYPVFSKRTRLFIFLPFYTMIVIRITLGIFVAVSYICQKLIGWYWYPGTPIPLSTQPFWTFSMYDYSSVLENSLGSLFCLMASSILLHKAYKLSKSRIATNNRKRIQTRMQFFAEALTMCFIPPIFINMASGFQLFLSANKYSYYRETQALNVNLSVIFSILATSWSSIRETLTTASKTEETKITGLPSVANNNQQNVDVIPIEA